MDVGEYVTVDTTYTMTPPPARPVSITPGKPCRPCDGNFELLMGRSAITSDCPAPVTHGAAPDTFTLKIPVYRTDGTTKSIKNAMFTMRSNSGSGRVTFQRAMMPTGKRQGIMTGVLKLQDVSRGSMVVHNLTLDSATFVAGATGVTLNTGLIGGLGRDTTIWVTLELTVVYV